MSPIMSGSTLNSISDRNESGILPEYVSCIVFVLFESTLSRYDRICLKIQVIIIYYYF